MRAGIATKAVPGNTRIGMVQREDMGVLATERGDTSHFGSFENSLDYRPRVYYACNR